MFTIKGRHEISILSSFKKYYNTWSVRLAPESADSFEPIQVERDGVPQDSYAIYRMKPQERYYEVCPAAPTGTGVFNSPVFLSNVIKYTYNGKKVFVSFSWQSYMESGVSAIGNGIQAEDVQVLDESLASPNASLVDANMQESDASVRSLARLHQDRAFIARLQLGVNITENWQLSLSGKFRDVIPSRVTARPCTRTTPGIHRPSRGQRIHAASMCGTETSVSVPTRSLTSTCASNTAAP